MIDPKKLQALLESLTKRREEERDVRQEVLHTIEVHHGKAFRGAAEVLCETGDHVFNLLMLHRALFSGPPELKELFDSCLVSLMACVSAGLLEQAAGEHPEDIQKVRALITPLQHRAVDTLIANQQELSRLLRQRQGPPGD